VGFFCERRDSGRVNPLLIEQPIRGPQDPFACASTTDRRGIPVHNIKYSERFTSGVPPAAVQLSKSITVLTKGRAMFQQDSLGYEGLKEETVR
jgi:hypothetical protein